MTYCSCDSIRQSPEVVCTYCGYTIKDTLYEEKNCKYSAGNGNYCNLHHSNLPTESQIADLILEWNGVWKGKLLLRAKECQDLAKFLVKKMNSNHNKNMESDDDD